jgi:hypothetical protein
VDLDGRAQVTEAEGELWIGGSAVLTVTRRARLEGWITGSLDPVF